MKIYLACVGMMCKTYGDDLIHRFIHPKARISELRSYWELQSFSGHTLPTYGKPYFLDSGAYSAFSRGVKITKEEYANFLLKYQDQIDVYANLDAIPATATPEAQANAAAESLKNQQYMESQGLKPLPVYHVGEPIEYLEHYVGSYDYICLGGMVNSDSIEPFLEEMFGHYLTNADGSAKVKVHGFGMTTLHLLTKYPWESVDSSTWLIHSKLGILALPNKLPNGEWAYWKKPLLVALSNASSMRQDDGRHYDNMTPDQRIEIEEFLDQFGMKVDELREHPTPRFIANLEFWIKVGDCEKLGPSYQKRQFELL